MDESLSYDFLVIRVWFEEPDHQRGFRARVLSGPEAVHGDHARAVADPTAVVALVEQWLAGLLLGEAEGPAAGDGPVTPRPRP